MTEPFAILVDFKLTSPSVMADFRTLINENARHSCEREPGCWRFDVLSVPGESDRIVLYEIYKDKAAFDIHLKSAHYRSFNRSSSAHVKNKTITTLSLAYEGSSQAGSKT